MPNQNYCRFENTYVDLSDCRDELVEMISGDSEYNELSSCEKQHYRMMKSLMIEMIELMEDIDDT